MIRFVSPLIRPKSRGLLLFPLILSLALSGNPLNHYSQQSVSGSPLGSYRSSGQALRSASVASAVPYDEQVGVTFTQNFSELAFNVTAVAFTGPDNVGPGYLVNGLTDSGYWYQVGLSYNWPLTSGAVNSGFSMNYEVFDSNGFSIDPSNGGGGLQSFNRAVSAGDLVLLSLNFSSGSVVMQAMDWQTRAVSSHSYTAFGTIFVGLQSRLDSPNGFFSGLMTEQYHRSPYYGAGLPVTYNAIGTGLSSAWMWMDEWDTNTGLSLFRDNTTQPVSLSASLGQYFSSNGTAEVASAHGLVTGLTPVVYPTLDASPPITGRPGYQISIPITINDTEAGTIRFTNLTISTSFGKYNFSLETPFSFGQGYTAYNSVINVPSGLRPGNYNVSIDIRSWQYLDSQAQEWIPLWPSGLNETLILTNNPITSTNPGSNPPSSGRGPSTSTNKTTPSPSPLLGIIRSIIIPVVVGYGALVSLAVALLIRQERKRSNKGPTPIITYCQSCGTEMGSGVFMCPNCGLAQAQLALLNNARS
ncbi:MAG TPA: hypothetical protein VGS11_11550 [Candidatus Bathyarchaeia archaeon]|nr:hypothetical protein [Candidatus Bathyarchaeia archaeon]